MALDVTSICEYGIDSMLFAVTCKIYESKLGHHRANFCQYNKALSFQISVRFINLDPQVVPVPLNGIFWQALKIVITKLHFLLFSKNCFL